MPNNEYLQFSEVRYSQVSTFQDSDPILYESAQISLENFEVWRQRISQQEFINKATFYFAQAWVGSPNMFKKTVPTRYRFEDARGYLQALDHPIWGTDYTTDALLQIMGIDRVT